MRELLNGSKDRTKIHTTSHYPCVWQRIFKVSPVGNFTTSDQSIFVDSPFHLSYAEPLKHHVQCRNKRQSRKTHVLLSTVTCLFSVFFTCTWFRLWLSQATRIGWKLHPEGPINRSDSRGPHTWKKANGRLWGDTAKIESRFATGTCQVGAMGINSHSWYASRPFGFFCYAHEQPDDWRIEED